ncbi:MAG: RNA-directed DNA polymerase, partial [Planctomycetaceae bacterium]|nr:RNA-directed DNA polymerase [Planctomycetaceae bacterium]
LRLIEQIIESGVGVLSDEATPVYFPGDDLLSILRPTGLPIGNLTSQFFANVLLDPIDHFIKERLRIPGYVRYADDLLLFADSKTELWEARDALAHELQPLRQRLHPDKTQICPSAQGVGFLGFRVTPTQRRLLQSTLRRFRKRCHRQGALFQAGALPARAVRESVRAWLAHISSANSHKIRNVLLGRLLLTRSGQ